MNDELKKELIKLNSKSLRILDLGFGSPNVYINLFEDLEKKEKFYFTGVELKDENEVFYMRSYDCVDFEKHFKFYYNTCILAYLKNISKEEKFDAIILSNILHKMEIIDVPFIMESCLSLMDTDAIIYICVLGMNYDGTEDENNKLFTLERYNSLKANFKILYPPKKDESCHLEFIGRKK